MERGTSAVLRASGVPCEVTGKIHEGKSSVVDAIAAVPTSPADRPLTPVRIKSITLVDETCDEEPETV